MSWGNEPKDPWSGRTKKEGPPDLDELIRKWFGFLLGKKQKSPEAPTPNSGSKKIAGKSIAVGVVALLVVIWFVSGIYIVGPAEEAVVLRFGHYLETTSSGLHWIPRFIKTRTIVNVQQIYNFGYQSDMLTEDENIVFVEVAVQYRVSQPFDYLYGSVDPLESLQLATASAVRQVVGSTNLDDILTTKRQAVTDRIQQDVISILSRYQMGLEVVQVTLQSTKPPEAVTNAFNDAIKAREDEQRYQNQAMAYASNVVPLAEGKAKRFLAEAQAYQEQVVLAAKAEVSAFTALLPSYHQAPDLMRNRLYLSTMESVLGKTSKVLLAVESDKNLLYLPLDRVLTQSFKESEPVIAPSSFAAEKLTTEISPKETAPVVYPSGYFQGDHT